MKNKLLVIGAGDIGRRVLKKLAGGASDVGAPAKHAAKFAARNFELHAATSNRQHRASLKQLGAQPHLADLDRPGTLQRLPRNWNALLHAAPPQSYPHSNERRDLRTRHLLRAIVRAAHDGAASRGAAATTRNGAAKRVLVYLSTSGVYGDCAGARITESQPVRPHNLRARRRVDAERRLIRAARRGAFRLIILRVPGIYASDRLPLARLRAGTPALRAEDDVFTNHIHAEDLAAITIAAFKRLATRCLPRVRIIHATDDSDMKMGEWFDTVADAFGLARPPRLPRAEIAAAVSPALLSFMNESRRLDNTRMKRELKVRLQFATAADGVAAAVAEVTAQA